MSLAWSRRWSSRRVVRRNLVAFAIALVVSAIAIILQISQSEAVYQGGPLHALESSAQDSVLRTRDPARFGSSVGRDPRQVITIVAIDERSLAALGLFRTWPRTYYAQVIDQLAAAHPRVIALDVAFLEPSADDAQLAAAIQRARAQLPPVAVGLAEIGGGEATRGLDNSIAFPTGIQPVSRLGGDNDVAATDVLPDDRGIVRSMPLLVDLGTVQRPTLGLLAAAKYLRRPNYYDARPDANTIVMAGRQIPVDSTGSVNINYFGPPSDPNTSGSTFNSVSFVDVLNGTVDPSAFQDKMVFVGLLGAAGFADDYWTPVSDQGHKMSGVEIHANVAATLLSTQFLREAPLAVNLALIVLLALCAAIVSANFGVVGAGVVTLCALGGYVLANLVVLDQAGLQLALATPLLAGVATFTSTTAYRFGVEQRHARALRGALASVVPPSVAEEIAREPDRVRLGGERRMITVLFTDLKGFTSFSERIDPELLSRVVAEYLDAMTEVVFRHGGTVDKFIGDAVMAFWNAPLDDRAHAQHACEAAIDMQATLERLGDRWQLQGLPKHQMRIGINTGPASVGNMGSSRRFAYTALGDAVNLAARLEPLNNEYGTWICISQSTLDAAGGRDKFVTRYLDLVAVKGKAEAVAVFELLGATSDAALVARYAPVLELYDHAIVLFEAQQLAAAAQKFADAQFVAANQDDPPSAFYIARCEELLEQPEAMALGRVRVMKHK